MSIVNFLIEKQMENILQENLDKNKTINLIKKKNVDDSDFLNHICLSRVFMKNVMLKSGNVFLSVLDSCYVLNAVKLAYLSMQPRTFRKNEQSAKIDKSSKEGLFKELSDKLVEFFKSNINNQRDFDNWHKKTCDWFLNELNKLLNASGYKNVAYGKAQKIINVAFKNLYLFDDAVLYENKFSLCHFIIDDTSLKWYNSFASSACGVSWSNMSYDKYHVIQQNIRNELQKSTNYPQIPFYAEFYIWADYYRGNL